jgi:glycerophosphoryl diester phosphodiesterase
MILKEEFLLGKHGGVDRSEDVFFINDDYVVIVDGATSKSPQKYDGLTSGQLISQKIISFFEENAEAESDGGVLYQKITQYLHDNMITPHNIDVSSKEQFPSASMAVLSLAEKKIWSLGDCQFLIDGEYKGSQKKIDVVTSEFRAAYNAAQLSLGLTVEDLQAKDVGREKIMPMLKLQTSLLNCTDGNPYAYGAMTGIHDVSSFIETIDVSDVAELILATDGYPKLFPTLQESEDYLQEILKNDPLLIRDFIQTKGLMDGLVSFDDRCYLRCSL